MGTKGRGPGSEQIKENREDPVGPLDFLYAPCSKCFAVGDGGEGDHERTRWERSRRGEWPCGDRLSRTESEAGGAAIPAELVATGFGLDTVPDVANFLVACSEWAICYRHAWGRAMANWAFVWIADRRSEGDGLWVLARTSANWGFASGCLHASACELPIAVAKRKN